MVYGIYIYIYTTNLSGFFFKVPKIKVQIGALDFHDYKFSQLISVKGKFAKFEQWPNPFWFQSFLLRYEGFVT